MRLDTREIVRAFLKKIGSDTRMADVTMVLRGFGVSREDLAATLPQQKDSQCKPIMLKNKSGGYVIWFDRGIIVCVEVIEVFKSDASSLVSQILFMSQSDFAVFVAKSANKVRGPEDDDVQVEALDGIRRIANAVGKASAFDPSV